MRLVGRIPVEPLDDERLTRIERRVVAGAATASPHRARAPRRSLGFAAAAIAVMVAGVIGWKLGTGAAPIVAEAAPLHVTTDARRSTLDIGDATIQSDPATAFIVTRPAGGVLVEMSRGKVALQVAKRANRPPLLVRAGDTDVIVVGTQFTVDYGDGTGDVDVRVTEGVVRIVRHMQDVRVAAGSAWNTQRGVIALAEAGTAIAAGAPPAGSDARAGTVAANDRPGDHPNADPDDHPNADPKRAGSDAYTIGLGDAPDVLHRRAAQVPDARVSASHPTGAVANAQPEPGVRAAPRPIKGSSLDLKALVAQQPIEPALDVGELPAQAIAKYYDIVHKTMGDEASRAVYSIAVVQALKLGRTGDALATLDNYLHRFTGGKEYTSALWLRVRVLCMRSIDERCRQAAYTYLDQAPESPARRIAERITISE